jgi:hypothetical protein
MHMKRWFGVVGALFALAVVQPASAQMQIAKYQWEGATVEVEGAGGEVALASPVVAAGGLDSLTILAEAATTDRSLVISCLAKDGATALFSYNALPIAAGSKRLVVLRADAPATPLFQAWAASTAYVKGARVVNGGLVYEVITAGTSAASGGPTGTTADITDNTVHWAYVGLAGAIQGDVANIPTSLCPRVKASMAAVAAGAGVTAKLAVYGYATEGRTKPVRYQYESGSVGSGAALSTGVIDAARLETLVVLAEASDTNRALVVSCLAKDGTTSLFDFPSLTVVAGSKYLREFRFGPLPQVEPVGIVHIPVNLCPRMKASIAAAGAAAAKLAAYGR